MDRTRIATGTQLRALATVGLIGLGALLTACSEENRPSDAEWRVVWEERRAEFPDAAAILEEGGELCDELVGRLRGDLPELVPTPDEALDAAVEDWIAHAETIAFECPDDPSELADRFETLDLLSAEVDAGLAADRTG